MAMILNLTFGCGSVLEGMFIILVNKRELKGGGQEVNSKY